MANVSPIAAAIKAAFPRLTGRQAGLLATQLGDLIDRGLASGWDFEKVQLVPRGRTSPLGDALRQLRDQRHRTQQQIASELRWSAAKIMRIEAGDVSVSYTDLRALLSALRADSTTTERLLAYARLPKAG